MHITLRFLVFVATVVCCAFHVSAQLPEDLSLHFDAAHIVGTGNSIQVYRVPVTNTATGQTVLRDVAVEFGFAEDGSLIVMALSSQDALPLPNSASTIIPGVYESSEGNRFIVSDGGITADGRVAGNIRSITDNLAFNAFWVSGPVMGHPLIGSREIAPELPDGQTYGIMGIENVSSFIEGGLITVSQIATSLVVTAYHVCCTRDTSSGVTALTLLRVPEEVIE